MGKDLTRHRVRTNTTGGARCRAHGEVAWRASYTASRKRTTCESLDRRFASWAPGGTTELAMQMRSRPLPRRLFHLPGKLLAVPLVAVACGFWASHAFSQDSSEVVDWVMQRERERGEQARQEKEPARRTQ